MVGGERSAETRRVRGVKRATREAVRPRGKKETRVARASSSAFRSSNAIRAERGKDRGRRAGTYAGTSSRTRRSSGASRRWSCLCRRKEGRERGGSARVRRSGGRGRVPERDARRGRICDRTDLEKNTAACSFPAPTMGRRGGSRTGTAVTDEDQLERGRLSHLSFLRAGAGNVGGQVRHSRGASRRPGEGAARRSEKLMKKRRANPRREARYAARTSRDRDARSRDDAPRASMRLPRACKVSEGLADSIVSTLKG